MRRVFEWRFVIRKIDPFLTSVYRIFFRWIYTWPAQVFVALISLTGCFTFISRFHEVKIIFLNSPWQETYFLFLLPMGFLAIFLHELGHALTTKFFGREVLSVGVGWHWISPIFYVDTSDMWLESKWPRMAVSFAGPYTNFFLAGLASLAVYFIHNPQVELVVWLFAAGSYVTVFMNLIPFLKYDGYYILNDLRSSR